MLKMNVKLKSQLQIECLLDNHKLDGNRISTIKCDTNVEGTFEIHSNTFYRSDNDI